MSGNEAMDETERAGSRAERRALRARRPLGKEITNAGSGQDRSQDAGGGVSGLVDLVLLPGGVCVRDGEVSGAVLGCRAGPEVPVSERVIPS